MSEASDRKKGDIQMKYLYVTMKDGSPRHVVSTAEPVTEGKVSARWVGLHPSVSGTARRGRPPAAETTYDASKLQPLEAELVESFQSKADAVWAEAPVDDGAN